MGLRLRAAGRVGKSESIESLTLSLDKLTKKKNNARPII